MQIFKPFGFVLAAVLASSGVLSGCGGSGAPSGADPAAEAPATTNDTSAPVESAGAAYGGAEPQLAEGALPEGVTETALGTVEGAPAPLDTPPVEGDWIVVHLDAEPATLNPHLEIADAFTQRVVDGHGGNIFETLLVRNRDTLEIEPWIAERWEVAEDKLTYTFYLRQDVKFSDGQPVTAHDVLFTFETLRNPDNLTADKRSYLTDFESATVLDDYTIQFKVTKPYFLHLALFTEGFLAILPKHIYSNGVFNEHPNNRAPVGSGPYKFARWDTGQQIVLVKRADYWGPKKPWVNELHFKVVTDNNAALQLARRQELDELRLSSEQWVRHATQPAITDYFQKYTLYSPVDGYASSFGWIGWNARKPMFADKRVRKAMTLLLDRETIGKTIYHGLVRTVSGPAFPESPAYDKNITPWPFDPEAAEALLDEAGWTDSNNDGVRDKDGVPFKYEWIFPSGSPEYEQLATVYKEELTAAGIDVTLRPLEWASFLESVNKRSFDACSMAWVSDVESDPYQIWHSTQAESGSNYVGFNVPEADRIIEEARLEFDPEKRGEMYRRFHAIIHEEQPYTFLYNSRRKVIISNRFQGVKPHPLGFDMRDWWVPRDQQKYK